MCGIAGIGRPREAANGVGTEWCQDDLHALAKGLAHRGPDAAGTFEGRTVALAHTRLAILDLTPAGAQPMRSPDGRFVLVFNGEIYNFSALRSSLERRGERFRGRSDTEVVLRLLALEGEAGLSKLEGMFALALLDTRTEEVLLARDRVGQKPLYLAELPGRGFAFCSELRPLLQIDGIDRGIAALALSHLLTFGFVPAPWTLRRGVRQLMPGSFERIRVGAPGVRGRFVPEAGPRVPLIDGDCEELSLRLEEVLSGVVRAHLVSDVPVGVLLSGGVDSSVVAALAARHAGRLQTYSVVHSNPLYDESRAARAVAAAIGSEHHEIELPEGGLSEEDLDVLVDHHGDPFADSSSINVLRLSRMMRESVTVALSGDGGDEVFAGYPRFGQLRRIEWLARLPGTLRVAGEAMLSAVGMRVTRQVARALRAASMPRERRMVAFTTLFWPEEQARMLQSQWTFPTAVLELERFLDERGACLDADPVASAHWMEQRLILPDDMLTKVDRMSMAASLEVRPPLIGDAVLDFAAQLPFCAKHAGSEGKLVLKAVARRLVPKWVVDRPKQGFALPLAEHGGEVLRDATRFALESESSPLRDIFRAEALDRFRVELGEEGEGRDPEDSPFRRVHRRWLLVLLARTLARHGVV